MKSGALLALLWCALVAPGTWAAGSQPASLTTLLERLPADTPGDGDRVMRSLTAYGPAGVASLAGMLVDPGEGDDRGARYALHGLALWHARPGTDAGLGEFARALGVEIRRVTLPSARAFLVRQVLVAGGPASINVLKSLILDERQGEGAVRMLVTIRDGVSGALLAALPQARGRIRLHIIQALGKLRAREAVPALLPVARNPDAQVRLAALEALGGIGDAVAAKPLLQAAISAGSSYERAKATAACLLLARRLSESGEMKPAARLYHKLWKGRAWRDQVHVRSHALRGLAETQRVAGMPSVLAAMESADPVLRAAAFRTAVVTPGKEVTRWWMQRANRGKAKARAAVLAVLGGRADREALSTVRAALGSEEQLVRLAAVAAAGSLGREEAVPWLVPLLASRDDDVRKAARTSLLHVEGEAATAVMAAALQGASRGARVALLGILADRSATAHLPVVLALTRAGDEAVRVAALKATGALGEESALRVLVEAILRAREDSERDPARDALVAVCGRQVEADPCARQILDALPRAGVPARCALLAALAHVGGADALAAVRHAVVHDHQPQVRGAAVQALADWPDPGPAGDLLEILRREPDAGHGSVALRGYLRLVGLPNQRSLIESVTLYAAAMEAVSRPEDRQLILSGLSRVGHLQALDLARVYLPDPALQVSAAEALVKIVKAMRGTETDEAITVLKKILDLPGAREVHKQARTTLEYLEEYGDYLMAWQVSDPYTKEDAEDDDLLDMVFLPEQSNTRDAGWWWPDQDPDSETPWVLDLGYAMDEGHCVAYLRTRVWSPVTQEARLELGSDDGIKAWLNGRVVHSNNAWRSLSAGEDQVAVTLRQGWNSLMLKVTQGGGDWAACARLRTPDGERLSGVRVRPAD